MSFKKLYLKESYSSDEEDDVLFDFYIPVLEKATNYDRLAGFFSSTSLAIAAKGISKFIQNKGNMRLVCSPELTSKDIEEMKELNLDPEKYIEINLLKELEDIESNIENDHVSVMGWMIANNLLEIRVAEVYDSEGKLLNSEEIREKGIFHQKVGVLYDDEDNVISFSGSINESASAWLDNIEEFKVFRSWDATEEKYLSKDVERFNKIWEGVSSRIRIRKLPESVEKVLIDKSEGKVDLKKYYNEYSTPIIIKNSAVNIW